MSYSPNMPSRREWCAALAKLVSPAFPNDAASALIDMLPALQHLPEHLFCEATLRDVAMAKRRQSVPAFDEIIRALNEYRARYLPDPTLRIAARPNAGLPDGREAPSPEEVAVVAELLTSWKREMAEARLAREEAERDLHPKPPPRDVTFSGQMLGDLRRARFAALVAERKLEPDKVPEAYRVEAPA